jgi:sugar phosphate isomerase/epimerase
MYSRRAFGTLTLSGLSAALLEGLSSVVSALESSVRGVKLGLITGSLSPLPESPGKDPIDVIIAQCLELGVANIELVNVLVPAAPAVVNGGRFGQPPAQVTPEFTKSREALRQWRLAQPLDRFKEVRGKFQKAGLNLFSYVNTIADDFTDAEIAATFKQMQALGIPMFTTNQTRVGMGPRIAPYAEKYGIQAAWHPHAEIQDPNEVATPESMEKLLAMSKSFVINLDIGHYTAGKNDAVAFIRKHHARITHLHVKDRKRDKGPNVQLGTGDTPIADALRVIRDNKYPIMAILEREYRDAPGTPVEQTRWQMDYMKRILEA